MALSLCFFLYTNLIEIYYGKNAVHTIFTVIYISLNHLLTCVFQIDFI